MVLKEEGHVFRVEGAGSRAGRIPKVNEYMTPYVLWILGLNLDIKYTQNNRNKIGKSGKGTGKVGSAERCEGMKGPERKGGLGARREEKGEEEASREHRRRDRSQS